MKEDNELLISKVELSDDKVHLYLHTRNYQGCNRLWGQLFGQLRCRTEDRQAIEYKMPDKPPESLVFDIHGDTDELISLLRFLEVELKDYSDSIIASITINT